MAASQAATQAATPANPFNLKSLADLISKKAYEELSDEHRELYDAAFAVFKQAHAAKYPAGQTIKLAIERVNWSTSNPDQLVIVFKDSPNRFTQLMRLSRKTADIMFTNALAVNSQALVYTAALATEKGVISMTVKLVDTSDTYTAADGGEEYYTAPGVSTIGNANYQPSDEIRAELKAIMRDVTADAIRSSIVGVTPAPTPVRAAPPVPVDLDEDDDTLLG